MPCKVEEYTSPEIGYDCIKRYRYDSFSFWHLIKEQSNKIYANAVSTEKHKQYEKMRFNLMRRNKLNRILE